METGNEAIAYNTFKVNKKVYEYWFCLKAVEVENDYYSLNINFNLKTKNLGGEEDLFCFQIDNLFGAFALYDDTISMLDAFASSKKIDCRTYKDFEQLNKYDDFSPCIEDFFSKRIVSKGYKNVNDFLKIRVFPLFYIINNSYLKERAKDCLPRKTTNKDIAHQFHFFQFYLKHSKETLKLGSNNIEYFKLMYERLNDPIEHHSLLKELTQAFLHRKKRQEKYFNQRKTVMAQIYIFLIFFPDKQEAISLKYYSESLFCFISSKGYTKPLKLSHVEVAYILRTVFDIEIAINTIKKYCKEMNLKTYNPKTGNKVNFETIKHPYLEKGFKEELEFYRNDKQ